MPRSAFFAISKARRRLPSRAGAALDIGPWHRTPAGASRIIREEGYEREYRRQDPSWSIPERPFRAQKRGRGDWIRTSDLLNPIQVRYQAALRPDRFVLRTST